MSLKSKPGKFLLITFILLAGLLFMGVGNWEESGYEKMKTTLRITAVALECYFVDNNVYPQPDTNNLGQPILPKSLTTPIAYYTSTPNDSYKKEPNNPLLYCSNSSQWIVVSVGPDKIMDIGYPAKKAKLSIYSALTMDRNILKSLPVTYDPTNGLNSKGDIWRTEYR